MPPSSVVDSEIVEVVNFSAGSLSLEGRFTYPESAAPQGALVLAGPHPFLGGNVENNVVRGLGAGLARAGVAVLAFNYRTTGGSQGGVLELGAGLDDFWADSRIAAEAEYKEDLAAAVAAMKELVGRTIPFALAGYSFGCSLLPSAAEGTDWPLALIAPTVGTHDYDAFVRVKNPVVVIAPRHDFAIDQTRLQGWFNVLPGRKQIVHGVWDDHFFRGFEDELSALVLRFLREEWEGATCR